MNLQISDTSLLFTRLGKVLKFTTQRQGGVGACSARHPPLSLCETCQVVSSANLAETPLGVLRLVFNWAKRLTGY